MARNGLIKNIVNDRTLLKVLKKMRAILDNPSHWCKGAFARDGAVDIAGAIGVAVDRLKLTNQGYIYFTTDYIEQKAGDRLNRFNDAPTTAHYDILDLLDERIATLKKKIVDARHEDYEKRKFNN